MKKLTLWIIMMMCIASITLACTVTLDGLGTLTNNSMQSTQSVTPNFIVNGNTTTWKCKLYTNMNGTNGPGTWREVVTDSNAANYTNVSDFGTYVLSETVTDLYKWDVFCNSTTDIAGCWGDDGNTTDSNASVAYGSTMDFGVDTTDPTLTITPADGYWQTGNMILGATVIDNNAAYCVLTTTMNYTGNRTQTSAAYDAEAYTNNTVFNFTGFTTTNTNMPENNTGAYTFSVTCNDTAGNTGSISTRTVYMDSTSPSAFWLLDLATNVIDLPNASTATDYNPQVTWNTTTELNFSRYVIFNGSTNLDNVTSISTLSLNVSTLPVDATTIFSIIAYDLAGNSVTATVTGMPDTYTTDSTSRTLASGWNTIMNTGNAITLGTYLNNSGATYTSYFNSTHGFQTQTSGGTTYEDTSVPSGEAIFVYMTAADVYEDLVLNTSAAWTKYNITNETSSDWNIVCNRNTSDSYSFQQLDSYLNGDNSATPQNITNANITYFSFYNNSASTGSKYIPFVNNLTMNNGTYLDYGDCVWLYKDPVITNKFFEINWLAPKGGE